MDIKLNLSWTGGMKGEGLIQSEGLSTKISIPAVYGGLGEYSNPKELYVASTAACFLSTLSAISDNKKLPLESLSVETNAHESDDEFSIHHIANIVLKSDATDSDKKKAADYTATADSICAVGNLARKAGVNVTAEPNITVAE
ncbi:osmotically inducible protein OsmC [Vibrio sp. CAIM 722]|uniref:Osmotically inducible protein OsmC n=1 Tax=Vibrio eleionomae TaxID=2653505 RepID=A0A7X4RV52_9VIBR|nr:OsmC family protein [Vibrio eleionomae]MZI94178.1 osmotically inducible protein OsmC [Vibrio eleionomae]